MFVKAEANADRDGVGDLSREDGQRVAGTKSFEGEEPLEHVLFALRSFRGGGGRPAPARPRLALSPGPDLPSVRQS